MKYLVILISLFALALPLTAEESSDIIKMSDFDRSIEGFSFTKGELVKLDQSEDGFPMDIDFIFDMPHGLGMNNAELTDWFPGTAGIFDLGPVSLDTDTDIPSEGFSPSMAPEDMITGHTYLILTADAERYGKIQIVQFDVENEILEFIWIHLDM